MITRWAESGELPSLNGFLAPRPLTILPSLLIPVLSVKFPPFSLLNFGGESVEALAEDSEWFQIEEGEEEGKDSQSPSIPSSSSTTLPLYFGDTPK
jgi:hypothetical protein